MHRFPLRTHHFELHVLICRETILDACHTMILWRIAELLSYSLRKIFEYTHFDEHGTPQLFDINVPCIFPPVLISMSQLMSQLPYPGFPKFHMKSNIETRLVNFEGSMDANGLADMT